MPDTAHSKATNQPDSISENGLPALSIDWELYGQYLDDSDLSEADKRACIEALWGVNGVAFNEPPAKRAERSAASDPDKASKPE